MRYTGFNWKFNPKNDVVIVKEKQPIYSPPIRNTSQISNTKELTEFLNSVHTPYRPNPLKHWRKQNVATTPTTMGRPVVVKNNMAIIDQPAYTSVTQATNQNYSEDCNDTSKCQSIPVEPDYMVAYRNKNTKDNIFGKGVKVTQRYNSGEVQYKRCVSVCDPERAARRRTQYPSVINTQVYTNENELCYNKSKYNQSNTEYLKSRCRTYDQNMTNKKADSKPWNGHEMDCAACPGDCGLGNSCLSSCKKRIIYKPNNYKFAQQGAVSGNTAINRKKYNTIQRFANGFTKPTYSGLYGAATAAAYAYSSNTSAPYTIKDKTFTSLQCRTHLNKFRRNGNKLYSCPT